MAFTDELALLLTDHCHFLQYLSLAGAVSISNMSMCYLLQRIGHRLISLYVEQCPSLSNSTLIAIVEFCESLEVLNITGTGMTADAVISLLIKPNRLLKLSQLLADRETLKTLGDFAEKKENGVSGRWMQMLK